MTAQQAALPREIVRIDRNHRRARASVVGDLVHVAGQVANDKSAGIEEQTRQALAKVDDLLAQAGTDKARILSVTIWLQSMADYDGFNAVWDAWVVPGAEPCRACAKVELADPAFRVEIIATAIR